MMEAPAKPNFLYDLVLSRVEWLAWLLTVLGLGLRYAGPPAGPIILLVGLSTLALVFFLRAFKPISVSSAPAENLVYVPVAQPSTTNFFLAAVVPRVQGIAGAITLIGVLFKLLFWFGSANLLVAGVPMLLLATAYQLALKQPAWRHLTVTILGLVVWLTPTETLVRQIYRDDPALVAKMIYQHQHPRDRAAAQQVQELLRARRQRLDTH